MIILIVDVNIAVRCGHFVALGAVTDKLLRTRSGKECVPVDHRNRGLAEEDEQCDQSMRSLQQ
ncbi:unnamed protein product [Prunus armeniaca]|uniref:Uncharacterized protein n=1 Tax=Prunus armeniaca TaxID=36596 RepID=A0A6J5V0K8_PRUAR|nr:unnamed protein product [Prunus armeniaca]CAB4312118.1 unnamed protein product [Prunus armeniaca]